MFFPEGNLRIWLCTTPTDMRKSYNGLSALVKHHLDDNPLSGNLYVFINRKANQMKILFFDRNGYSIWSKRYFFDSLDSEPVAAAEMLDLIGVLYQHEKEIKAQALDTAQTLR